MVESQKIESDRVGFPISGNQIVIVDRPGLHISTNVVNVSFGIGLLVIHYSEKRLDSEFCSGMSAFTKETKSGRR
jgi:hypothetical protein